MEPRISLTERIRNRFELHQREIADNQRQLDEKMKEMLDQRERYAAVAKNAIESVVKPRMKELATNFENAQVEMLVTDMECICACEFAHTPRFPATVRLAIALSAGETENITARYDLSIFPILMDFTRNTEDTFQISGNDDALSGWVEDRILDFIDTYFRLETHPMYQKDNTVVDIVCGMRIPSIAATSTVERHGRIFYFCSEHCKDAFVKRKTE